ncbi:MAG TPA: AMP-binding protein [Gaiellaceae bacterium]|nr:AMP-binding protein [Gaiellaceae bacterium]
MSDFIWEPTPELVEQANVTWLARRLGAADYRELHRISIEEPDRFWPEVVADLGIEFSQPWESVVDTTRGPEWATWFNGARVNIARVCLHRWAGDGEALVGLYEDGTRESLSWSEASRRVTQLAEALVELGVEEGDRVAIYMPMCPAVAIASHACAHVGAVQVPIFSGFAAPAIASRLDDSQAKAVICANWSLRRGKRMEMRATLDEAGPHAVEHVVEWNRDTRSWPDVVTRQPGTLPPREVDSEAPYLLAYTSGTTGKPKGALHVQGGFLVSIARETAYQTDVKAGDRIHFATDMGWIMGPWTVVGGGAAGATIVFAEGAPDWPNDRLWRLVEVERVTMLGLSPTLVRALLPHGDPAADLSSLRAFCTTGEPWNPDPYRWLFENVGRSRVPIVNISGGTEVGACFLTTVITEPIKPVALGFPALGEDMDVVDAEGRPVRGEVGELVCRRPWPGMTRGIWGEDERYLDAYWRRFPGIWTHGDWASVDEDGYWFLHGRSDDTLNIAGKRIGPSELESAAISSGIVAEAAAVGVPHEVKGEVAWIFCVAKPGDEPDDARVAAAVSDTLGKAFKPDRIVWVGALPKTRSAKIVRRAVRARALGLDPGDLSSLENPESLEEIADAVR